MLQFWLTSLRSSQQRGKRLQTDADISWVRCTATPSGLRYLVFVTFLVLPIVGQATDSFDAPPEMNGKLPNCNPQMDGQVLCKFGTIYECELIGPNSMERRSGWRWRADVLRGCAEPSPATIDQQNSLPPDITYLPRPTNQSGAQGGQHGTMHIYPDGSPRPSNGSRRP
jgi:hypothetical protein